MDLVRGAIYIYISVCIQHPLIIKWNPSLRTPLKVGHLSNKDIFSFPQNHTIYFQSQK